MANSEFMVSSILKHWNETKRFALPMLAEQVIITVAAVLLTFIALKLPPIFHRRPPNYEASAVSSLRTLISAEAIYLERSQGNVYGSLADLHSTGLIDSSLASGVRIGYRFKLTVDQNNPEYLFTITASPLKPGKTGDRWFFVNQTGVFRFSETGPADVNSTPLGAR